jgi:hypothetical protein
MALENVARFRLEGLSILIVKSKVAKIWRVSSENLIEEKTATVQEEHQVESGKWSI